jgi:NADPH-dependent glutamate synthase beta subunit-like oxidoreductase/ferredoxin
MPVTLTIDGRQTQVERGATILEAARQLGIEIPTLCHRDGVRPIGSCFLCAVAVEGRRTLVPSCTAPAEDGMAVTTDSEDIRAARRTALELLLSDHVGDCEAPCTVACPASLDIPNMLRHIKAGEDRRAIALIKQTIPLAGAFGRICPRFCERVCRRRELDEPIAICAMKRFPADADCEATEAYCPPRQEATGKSVAVIGAGPAGLTAAFFLLREGHACTLFDAHEEPGGMFRHAIPAFRLPREALAADLHAIRELGAELRMNHRLGEDVILEELRDEFDAVLLATGAQGEEAFEFDGASHARSALEFLHAAAHEARPQAGDSVLVLGGGNEAVDAARTARRLGADEVTIVWDGPLARMRAQADYVAAAEEEGVAIEADLVPSRLERHSEGRLELHATRGDQEVSFQASTAIAAPDRRVEADLLESQGLPVSRGRVKVDRETLATGLSGVFAAGECVNGPTAGIRAATAGRVAARSIGQFLSGESVVGEPTAINVRLGKLTEEQKDVLFRGRQEQPREEQPVAAPAERRNSFDEAIGGLSRESAVREAGRCLDCDCAARDDCKLRRHATAYGAEVRRYAGDCRSLARDESHPRVVYEPGKCILCQLCTRIAEAEGEPLGMALVRRGFVTEARVPFGRAVAEGLTGSAERCVEACPTGALAWKRRNEEPRDG